MKLNTFTKSALAAVLMASTAAPAMADSSTSIDVEYVGSVFYARDYCEIKFGEPDTNENTEVLYYNRGIEFNSGLHVRGANVISVSVSSDFELREYNKNGALVATHDVETVELDDLYTSATIYPEINNADWVLNKTDSSRPIATMTFAGPLYRGDWTTLYVDDVSFKVSNDFRINEYSKYQTTLTAHCYIGE